MISYLNITIILEFMVITSSFTALFTAHPQFTLFGIGIKLVKVKRDHCINIRYPFFYFEF